MKGKEAVSKIEAIRLLKKVASYGSWGTPERNRVNKLRVEAEATLKAVLASPAGAKYQLAKRRLRRAESRVHDVSSVIRDEVESLRVAIQVDGLTPRNLRRLKILLAKKFKL